MTRRVVVVYNPDNRDAGKALGELTDSFGGPDSYGPDSHGDEFRFISRDELLEKDTRNALVIVAGGDGTLLGASHRILDNYSLVLGCRLNESSVGYYCATDVKHAFDDVNKVLMGKEGKDYIVERLPRLECIMHTDTGNWVRTDLALNEYFIANTCAYFPSKYKLSCYGSWDYQRSSGILVCTYHGYSGWVQWARGGGVAQSEYDFRFCANAYNNMTAKIVNKKFKPAPPEPLPNVMRPEMNMEKGDFFVHVREPIGKIGIQDQRLKPGEKLHIVSDMHRGYVVPDSFDEYHFNRGTELEIRLSDHPLNLIRFPEKPKRRKGGSGP